MTMKTKKTLQHVAAVAVVLLMLCLVFIAPVSADTQVSDEADAVSDATTDENTPTSLTPGENVEGAVVWTQNDDKYKLEILAPGEYSLTAGFTASQIVISSNDVVLNGNNHQIIIVDDFGQFKVSYSDETGDGVVLTNLNITAGPHYKVHGLVHIEDKTVLQNSVIDYSADSYNDGLQLSVIYVVNENAAGTQITGNTIKLPDKYGDSAASNQRGVCIDGVDNVVVTKNTFVLGKAYNTESGTPVENHAIHVKGIKKTFTNGYIISENAIFATSAEASNIGVSITPVSGSEPDFVISNNEFISETNVKYTAIIESIVSAYGAGTINLELKDNTISSVDSLIYIASTTPHVANHTITGVITNNEGTIGTVLTVHPDYTGSINAPKIVTGGYFSSNPSAYIASGYEVVQPGDKYLVQKYVDRSSSSSSSSKPVEEPEEPEQPEEPVVEPETPAAPGEATVETEVTDGGEVELETPAAEGEGGSAAADEDEAKITGVVLPTGTDSEVTFVPVSEQPAPAGQEENTKKVFEINVPTYEKGKAAVIKFTMTVAELAADGKEAADVALWHFDEETGEWTKLVTSYVIVDGVVYFEAITNDFSPFAIIYEDEPEGDMPGNEPQDKPETPESPAPVLGLLAALGAAVVIRRK